MEVFFLLRIFCTFELSCHLLCLVIFSRFVLVFSICVLLCINVEEEEEEEEDVCMKNGCARWKEPASRH